jgi:metal-dependent amidase/aminoacylase/carboxypeptidase family protein
VSPQSLTFKFTVQGRGGHAAMPHLNIDPVPAAAALVQALQVLVSRETSPLGSAVLSITQLQVCCVLCAGAVVLCGLLMFGVLYCCYTP